MHTETIPTGEAAGTPSVRWLPSWAAQRFPLKNLLFFLPLFLAALVAARGSRTGPIRLHASDVVSFVAFWSFFLVLRVFDEHKDFAADALAHPHRVLQRGLVTLGQLRALAGLAIALQIGASLWRDGGQPAAATLWWAAAFGWSVLMAREFFASRWLRAHLIPYALTHMLVMPLLVAWAAALSGRAVPDAGVVAVAALAFAGGLAVEVARKLRAPEDERPTADSYTQALGMNGAIAAAAGTLALASLIAPAAALAVAGRVSAVAVLLLAVTTGYAAMSLFAFRRAPSARATARAEVAVAGSVLVGLAGVIAAAAGVFGVGQR